VADVVMSPLSPLSPLVVAPVESLVAPVTLALPWAALVSDPDSFPLGLVVVVLVSPLVSSPEQPNAAAAQSGSDRAIVASRLVMPSGYTGQVVAYQGDKSVAEFGPEHSAVMRSVIGPHSPGSTRTEPSRTASR